MLNTQALHKEILALLPDIRRTVRSVLRNSRYYADDHVEDCVGDIMIQIYSYAMAQFDPSKGSAKSHFCRFAYARSINWLAKHHRRFECADEVTNSEGITTSISAQVPADGNPEMSLVRAQECSRIRAAVASLQPRQRALLEAFERLHSWTAAAKECGMSPAGACRMKDKIAAHLQECKLDQ